MIKRGRKKKVVEHEEETVFDAETGEREPEPDAQPQPEPEPVPASTFADAEPEPEPEAPPERTERRGRPKGSTGKRKDGRQAESPENISKILLACFSMMSALVSAPELLLTEREAMALGEAIHDVEKLYTKSALISPEIQAFTNLGLVGIMIGWPRYVAIKRRLDAEAKEAKANRPIEVTPIREPAFSAEAAVV